MSGWSQEAHDKLVEEGLVEPTKGVTNAELRNFLSKREARDRLKIESDSAEKAYRVAEAFIWERMDDQGDELIKRNVPGHGTVRIERRSTLYSRVVDLDTLLDTLEKDGRADELTKPAVEKKRLNELVRECLEQGIPLPEGADFYEKKYIRLSEAN